MVSRTLRSALLALALAALACAADSDAGRWISFGFPPDSPVLPASFEMGNYMAKIRGTSILVEIHTSVVLRNIGTKTVSGLTLRVEPQDMPAGKASVTVPSLNAQPGETFPVRIDMEISRPISAGRNGSASLIQVSLDCALFSDLTAYGPDKLNSRHTLVVYEMQARRERQYLAALLHDQQWAKLRNELDFGLPEATPMHLGLEFIHGPLATVMREQDVAVSPVAFSGAPVQPIGGGATVVGNEVRAPHVELRKTSTRPLRSLEIGWIVRDEHGRDFVAGSIPVKLSGEMVQSVKITDSGALRFSSGVGRPMVIGSLRAFVNDVEFSDGKLWIPSRVDIDEATSDPVLRHELSNSPEQQRLAKIYRMRGTTGLAEELKRGN